MRERQLSDNAAYMHYRPNETIDGIAIDRNARLRQRSGGRSADFSSTILSRPIDVSRYSDLRWRAEKYRLVDPTNRHRS